MRSLSTDFWPGKEIANDLFEHFACLKFSQDHGWKVAIHERRFLRRHLTLDRKFIKFWDLVQEMHPEREGYFASLLDSTKPYKPEWLTTEFNKFQFGKEFEQLSGEEKQSLEDEFDNLRPSAYQFALKAEAQRLNFDVSDVRPKSPVLPLEPGYDPRFILAALPDEILAKTMHYLDSFDVFRMTLVCRRWKDLVYNNCAELKRAEHAVTTHLITFTNWMDPAKTPSCMTFTHQYYHFSWGLVRWCCGISNNLETLILDHPMSYPNVATLLQSCSNLKILQLGDNSAYPVLGEMLQEKVRLPNLEVYLCTEGGLDGHSQQVKRDILCSVKRLRVLRASIQDGDMEGIQSVRPMGDVFHHLIALDLTCFSDNVLQMLATLPNLQLKYLRLGSCRDEYIFREHEYEIATTRYRDLFHQLLKRLRKLEVLETWFVPGVTNETIQLLIDLDLNLQFAILGHSLVRLEPHHIHDMCRMPADPLDPNLLSEFRDRLLLRNPELDLSDFHFVVAEPELRDQLLAADIGFTLTHMRSYTSEDYVSSGLCYPAMRNRLNIDFRFVLQNNKVQQFL